jgi:hypothetical protein
VATIRAEESGTCKFLLLSATIWVKRMAKRLSEEDERGFPEVLGRHEQLINKGDP